MSKEINVSEPIISLNAGPVSASNFPQEKKKKKKKKKKNPE